jgi:hypothetical protein
MHSDIVIRQLERMLKVPLVCGSGCHPAAGRTVELPKGRNIVLERCGRARGVLPQRSERVIKWCSLKLEVLSNRRVHSASSDNTAPRRRQAWYVTVHGRKYICICTVWCEKSCNVNYGRSGLPWTGTSISSDRLHANRLPWYMRLEASNLRARSCQGLRCGCNEIMSPL